MSSHAGHFVLNRAFMNMRGVLRLIAVARDEVGVITIPGQKYVDVIDIYD